MVKKRVNTQSKSATTKEKCTPCGNPIVHIAKITAFAVFLVSLSFLLFGNGDDIIYAIPTSMGLILLGIVLGLLSVRK